MTDRQNQIILAALRVYQDDLCALELPEDCTPATEAEIQEIIETITRK